MVTPPNIDSRRLRLSGLPVIDSLDDLSREIRVSKGTLYRLSKFNTEQYRRFQIPKKSGGMRKISQPAKELKAVQAWILRRILNRLQTSSASTGFELGSSISRNAEAHAGSKIVACLDIENFFPSVPSKRVYWLFRTLGYSWSISDILTQLTTLDGGLPQGSPASPKLANLVCARLDHRLLGYAGRRGIAYTRYADDMTFSCQAQSAIPRALPLIRKIIEDEGFSLNLGKTRVMGPARQRRVTGLILSDTGFGIGRTRYRALRAKAYNLAKPNGNGVGADIVKKRVAELKGWLAFTKDVDTTRHGRLVEYIGGLDKKFPSSAISELAPK